MTLSLRAITAAASLFAAATTAVVAAEPVPATAVAAASEPGKTGYLNMEKVFQGYFKTMRSDAAFKKQRDIYEQHFNDARDEMERIKRQRDDCRERSLNIALSDDVRNQNRKEAEEKDTMLRDKDRELRDFFQKKDVELKRKFMELRGELVKELSDYIKTYAVTNRYEAILDTSGMTQNMIPAVVYYDTRKDLSDTLLAELNRGHEEEIAKAKEAVKPTGAIAAPAAAPVAVPAAKPAPAPAAGAPAAPAGK
ncbi:MAG: OmpH family outer membrane protein [Lentisphaeria bacterium]